MKNLLKNLKECLLGALLGIFAALLIGTCGVPTEEIINKIPLNVLEFTLFNGWTIYDILELIFC